MNELREASRRCAPLDWIGRPCAMRHRHVAAVVVAITAVPAVAEVSDKMPTVGELWLRGCAISILLFVVGRLHPAAAALAFVAALLIAVGSYDMVNDEYIGRAVRAEQGLPYVAAAYGSAGLCVLAAIAAASSVARRRAVGRSKAREHGT